MVTPSSARPGPDDADVRATLRARGRAARRALSPDERSAATAAIVGSLAVLPEIVAAARVLLTRAIGDELDLLGLEQRLRATGTVVALPVVRGHELLVVDLLPGTVTAPGWRGVPEPSGEPVRGTVDAVVVPALAVDRDGERLGYGGGHFDRLLAGGAAGACAIGAVFDVQVVDHVPRRPHDVRLDVVVTEREVVRATPRPPDPR